MMSIWDNFTALSLSPINFIVRAALVYIFILALLRFSGKRQMGSMSPTEFVAVLLISNAVQNSMTGGDNSLLGGFILAATLILLSWLVNWLTYRSQFMSRLIEGIPRLIIYKGELVKQNLHKERLTPAELHVLLRKQGIHSLKEIHNATLEADGTLSIIRETDLK